MIVKTAVPGTWFRWSRLRLRSYVWFLVCALRSAVTAHADAVPSSTARCSLSRGREFFLRYMTGSYLTSAHPAHGASHCIRGVLCRGCAVAAASWLETRTRGPRNQPRTTGKLSQSVLFSTERCDEFQDMQPRDVDHSLFLYFLELLVVGGQVNHIRDPPTHPTIYFMNIMWRRYPTV